METYSGERKARGRLELVGGGADYSNQSSRVETLSEAPMCHDRGTRRIGAGAGAGYS